MLQRFPGAFFTYLGGSIALPQGLGGSQPPLISLFTKLVQLVYKAHISDIRLLPVFSQKGPCNGGIPGGLGEVANALGHEAGGEANSFLALLPAPTLHWIWGRAVGLPIPTCY